jgi:hypothetical protein
VDSFISHAYESNHLSTQLVSSAQGEQHVSLRLIFHAELYVPIANTTHLMPLPVPIIPTMYASLLRLGLPIRQQTAKC